MHTLSVTPIPLSYHCLRWFCCNSSTCLVLWRRDTFIHSTHHPLMVLQVLSHLSASVEHWCATCCCLLLSAVRSWDTEVRSALSNLAEGEKEHQYSVLHDTMVHCNMVLDTTHVHIRLLESKLFHLFICCSPVHVRLIHSLLLLLLLTGEHHNEHNITHLPSSPLPLMMQH